MEFKVLNGKNLKKALHQVDHININLYRSLNDLFGDWLNQDFDFLKKTLSCTRVVSSHSDFRISLDFKSVSSTTEKKRVFEIIKKDLEDFSFGISSIFDHMRFYVLLKNFGEDIKWMSETNEQFREEHLDWTDKVQFYRRGNYERIYPNYFIEKIQTPITFAGSDYYPVLLQTSKDYNEESLTQSNCVKTYIGRVGSIIVSLRKDSLESEERVTLEYSLSLSDETIKCVRVQSRGKYNSEPLDGWYLLLTILDSRMMKLVHNEKFETVKLKKICANGKELFSDSQFTEKGFLDWTYKIDNKESLWENPTIYFI